MNKQYKTITLFIALVWFINGLVCKIINAVPRHQDIVSEILDINDAITITKIIGFLEVFLAIWILSFYKSKVAAITQITLVLVMNIIEFIKAPNLLLFGRFNLAFSIIFVVIIALNEFYIKQRTLKLI